MRVSTVVAVISRVSATEFRLVEQMAGMSEPLGFMVPRLEHW